MAGRSFVIAKAAWRERGGDLGLDIEKARQAVERLFTQLGVASGVDFDPDVVKIRVEMERTKKALSFVAVLAGGMALIVYPYIGSAFFRPGRDTVVVPPIEPDELLAWMRLLKKHTPLVTDADIKEQQAGSTREADVAKLKAQMAVVQKQAAVIASQIKKLQAALKPKTDEIERLKKELAKFGE